MRISTRWTVPCCDRPRRLPSFAAVAGAAELLAGGPIRGDLQAHRALARAAEQAPASTPAALPEGTIAEVSPPCRPSSGRPPKQPPASRPAGYPLRTSAVAARRFARGCSVAQAIAGSIGLRGG